MGKKPRSGGSGWQRKLSKTLSLKAAREGHGIAYLKANSAAVQSLMSGAVPGGGSNVTGAYMAVNMSCANIAAFCIGDYLNCYDRNSVSASRDMVDKALPLPAGVIPQTAYFGALELTGAGVRYYGDICLVLKRDVMADETLILERNSFDLLRSPFKERIRDAKDSDFERKHLARLWSGSWQRDVGVISAVKLVSRLHTGDRLWTLGQVAAALCDDEDYIEVIKHKSFAATDLLEARTTAADVAYDAQIRDRAANGPTPSIEALTWSIQRKQAEFALRRAGVPLRVVTTVGRARG